MTYHWPLALGSTRDRLQSQVDRLEAVLARCRVECIEALAMARQSREMVQQSRDLLSGKPAARLPVEPIPTVRTDE